ncbi:MAG: ornithine carbamoyltransferase [Rhodospirillaceae bacterium]|nr:MAG: ornithine carbamoyltransferase [Rhodospirillaceae bacterium]
MFRLRGRNFLSIEDFNANEIAHLLRLAAELKSAKDSGTEQQKLRGKSFALLFEKDSTRTRSGFEVAAFDQGANVTYIGPSGSHLGHKESPKDTARVLGRMYDGIEYRGFDQRIIEIFAQHAGVPVWNGLTDQSHPTQVLADLLTMQEHCPKPFNAMRLCFLGDVEDNVATSLAIGAVKLGVDMRIAGPKSRWPNAEFCSYIGNLAKSAGGEFSITDDIGAGVKDCDFLYTDVWLSMGEPEERWAERIHDLMPYQVTSGVMAASGNPAVKFMHCLPAFHNTDTEVGQEIFRKFGIDAMEVTDQVFESTASIVFDQAENRLHTIKAIMVATAG